MDCDQWLAILPTILVLAPTDLLASQRLDPILRRVAHLLAKRTFRQCQHLYVGFRMLECDQYGVRGRGGCIGIEHQTRSKS